ncbi:MAG: phosphoenolpyruvate carboxylase, partial [Sphingobacteriales bacterium]
KEPQEVLQHLADDSFNAFKKLRTHEQFLPYLEQFTPLTLLSKINISSRPVKRNSGEKLKLEDLRAISFVTSWSMIKQNIPGYYGFGIALKKQEKEGNWPALEKIYLKSDYFRTIIDNCMMSMRKTDFRITEFIGADKNFGEFWKGLKKEYDLTKKMLLKLSGQTDLMENYPLDRTSISLRESIVLPLVVIQQFALQRMDVHKAVDESYEKLALRTVFGIVNAGRNLA